MAPTPCSRCGAPTVEIGLLQDQNPLTMRSCSRCDHREWLREGSLAPLGTVLDAVAATGRRRSA